MITRSTYNKLSCCMVLLTFLLACFAIVHDVYGNPSDDPIEAYGYLIPHTHDDVGWLTTPEKYYSGASMWDGYYSVKVILQTIVKQLEESSIRRFNWQETFYFNKFWQEDATEAEKALIKKFVKEKRFEFVGGGWVCNDEALPTIDAIVSQLSTGHDLLYSIFGDDLEIKSTWQIDPFGHSKTMAMVAQQAGYKYHVLNRVDERLDRQCSQFPNEGYTLGKEKSYQFYWDTTSNDTPIFTHILDHHYSSPEGNYNESLPNGGGYNLKKKDLNFQKHPLISGSTTDLQERAHMLADYIKKRANSMYQTPHILLPFGDDFSFRGDNMFANGDLLIAEINDHPEVYGVKVVYATVSEYFEKVEEADKDQKLIPTKTYDAFMPYANCWGDIDYWTGYYTTFPKYKLQIRDAQRYLHHMNMMHAFGHVLGPSHDVLLDEADAAIEALTRELAIAQHHDAITGTSKAFVRDDYQLRLETAQKVALDASASLMSIILTNSTETTFRYDGTLQITDTSKVHPIVIQNPQLSTRNAIIRLSANRGDVVISMYENDVEVYLTFDAVKRSENNYELFIFVPNVPAMGYRTIFIVPGGQIPDHSTSCRELSNAFYNLAANVTEKRFMLNDKQRSITTMLQTSISVFSGSSGAYLFRPYSKPTTLSDQFDIQHSHCGPLVNEMTIAFTPFFIQTFRLYKVSDPTIGYLFDFDMHSETDFLDVNNEFFVNFHVDSLSNNQLLYSDANSFETIKRPFEAIRYGDDSERSYYAGNVYPMTSHAFIRDTTNQLSLFSYSSFGVASFSDGHLSMMIRRSTSNDDSRGVGEAVVDHGVQRQSFKFSFQAPSNVRMLSALIERPSLPIIIENTQANDKSFYTSSLRHFFNPLSFELDSSILLSFRHLPNHELLLQLFSGSSSPFSFSLSSLFNDAFFQKLSSYSIRPLTAISSSSTPSSSLSVPVSPSRISSVSFSLSRLLPNPSDPSDPSDPDHPTPIPDSSSSFFEFWNLLRFGLFFALAFGITLFLGLVIVGLTVCFKRSSRSRLMSSDNLQRLQIFTREDSYDELDEEEMVEMHVSDDDLSDPLSSSRLSADDDDDDVDKDELEKIAKSMQSSVSQQNSTLIDDQFDVGVVDADDDQFSLM